MANYLMTSAEQAKLEAIETGAEVNVIEVVKQNGSALSITDKSVNVVADANVIEGIKLSDSGSVLTPTEKIVTIPNATTSADGLMSSEDKTKLEGKHYKMLTADFSNNATTYQQIAMETDYWEVGEDGFFLKPNEVYNVRIIGKVVSAANETGFAIGFKSSSSASIVGSAKVIVDSTVTETAILSISDISIKTVIEVSAGDTDGAIFILDFLVKFTSADGVISLYAKTGVMGSAITIKSDAAIIIEKTS